MSVSTRRGLLAGGAALMAGPGVAWAAEAGGLATVVERIAEATSAATADRLPDSVARRVELALADNLATLAYCGRASKSDPFVARMAERGGRPEAAVLGTRLAAPAEDAAAALAYLIHYAETDDSDFRAELRASPTVMGPALALAQHPGVTGADLTAAIAVGYSVLGGLAQPFGATQDDGLMAAGVWGPSASAAVAARLLKLDAIRTAHAIALAAGGAGGTFQYFFDQTEEKRLIVARAARVGVEAALMAAAGEHGPRRAYEGQAGLFALIRRITGSQPDTSRVVEVIARLDGPLYIYPKFFSASSSVTPTLEGLAPLVAGGLKALDVDRFALRGDPNRYQVVGSKLGAFVPPTTRIGAKMNYAYMVAFYLTHGAADGATVDDARIDDPAVMALAARSGFEAVPGVAGELVLYLKDGRIRAAPILNQTPGEVAPEALDLRREKVDRLAGAALGRGGGDQVRALAASLAGASSARAWARQVRDALLARGPLERRGD